MTRPSAHHSTFARLANASTLMDLDIHNQFGIVLVGIVSYIVLDGFGAWVLGALGWFSFLYFSVWSLGPYMLGGFGWHSFFIFLDGSRAWVLRALGWHNFDILYFLFASSELSVLMSTSNWPPHRPDLASTIMKDDPTCALRWTQPVPSATAMNSSWRCFSQNFLRLVVLFWDLGCLGLLAGCCFGAYMPGGVGWHKFNYFSGLLVSWVSGLV